MKSGPKEGEVWLEFHRWSMFKDEGQKGLKKVEGSLCRSYIINSRSNAKLTMQRLGHSKSPLSSGKSGRLSIWVTMESCQKKKKKKKTRIEGDGEKERLSSTLLLSLWLQFPRSKWDKNNTKNWQRKERCKGKKVNTLRMSGQTVSQDSWSCTDSSSRWIRYFCTAPVPLLSSSS